MRNAWFATITVVACAAGFTATIACADPASMAMQGRRPSDPQGGSFHWPWSSSTTTAAAPMQPAPVHPSALISPWQHPVKYFEASISEMPIGSKAKTGTHPVMPPAQQKTDAISLSTPTGPPSPEFFIFAAQMCEHQGDVQQARQNYQRAALSMWPGHVEVLRAAARMEDRQGNLPLAESLYQKAVASNPQHAGALNDLGLCLARQGKLEPSLQAIEQAIQFQPAKPLYRNNAATVLVEMHQDQRALAHLSAVTNPAEANYNLGQLLVARGRSADAAPYFQAALQQNPNMQSAQEALAKLQGAPALVATQPALQAQVMPQAAAPVTPTMAPQPTWPAGPQMAYPATARTPGAEASSYVPPRYLPPVASQPGPLHR